MRVGLLTSHGSMNFGGLLQAYALRQTIIGMGHECAIINYVPQMHDLKSHPFQFVFRRKGFIRKAFFGVSNYRDLEQKQALVQGFREEHMHPVPEDQIDTDELPPKHPDTMLSALEAISSGILIRQIMRTAPTYLISNDRIVRFPTRFPLATASGRSLPKRRHRCISSSGSMRYRYASRKVYTIYMHTALTLS